MFVIIKQYHKMKYSGLPQGQEIRKSHEKLKNDKSQEKMGVS